MKRELEYFYCSNCKRHHSIYSKWIIHKKYENKEISTNPYLFKWKYRKNPFIFNRESKVLLSIDNSEIVLNCFVSTGK